ncbi:accessory Sec system protein Asp2 [Lentilactobacillus raoultii]|uniref:Accessory Sec system protein Asp2 n=1 Tax=Lentilactobacillus raoultii TaxID=1987503 RepID=A0ABW3PEC3_9LACO|nr:accessory Sec system protein Asp2 [Lentilactobacillus raoultii]
MQTSVLQLGGEKVEVAAFLDDTFKFTYLPMTTPEDVVDAQNFLLTGQSIKDQYQSAVFILGDDSYAFLMPDLLLKLRANKIICGEHADKYRDSFKLLQRKNVIQRDLTDGKSLGDFINNVLFSGQYGDLLDFNDIAVLPKFQSHMEQFGTGELQLKNLQLDQLTQVINWRMTLSLAKNTRLAFWPEFELLGQARVVFKLYLLDQFSGKILMAHRVGSEKLLTHPFILDVPADGCNLFVTALLKGSVEKFSVRNLYLRRDRYGFGGAMVGSKMITDSAHCGGQLGVYFNAGNLKPPLNVYFGGWRTAVGFEGAGIMSRVGDGSAPYLLLSDERLEGGAFYIGDDALEQQIVVTIKKYLKVLNFSNTDLVLSGISMGSTAALYYAADLDPGAVIVGKPLANLGTMAQNERLIRPYGYPTSLDILLLNEGATDAEAQSRLNQHFWDHFKTGAFTNPTINIAYMKQDDYDHDAFSELFHFLKDQHPTIKILYKGLTGRHNDDTPGIVSWFMRQFENTMQNKFNRGSDFING